jgi:hypothetical protein
MGTSAARRRGERGLRAASSVTLAQNSRHRVGRQRLAHRPRAAHGSRSSRPRALAFRNSAAGQRLAAGELQARDAQRAAPHATSMPQVARASTVPGDRRLLAAPPQHRRRAPPPRCAAARRPSAFGDRPGLNARTLRSTCAASCAPVDQRLGLEIFCA